MELLACDPEVEVYWARCDRCGAEFNPYPGPGSKETGSPQAYMPKDEHLQLVLVARVGPKTNER